MAWPSPDEEPLAGWRRPCRDSSAGAGVISRCARATRARPRICPTSSRRTGAASRISCPLSSRRPPASNGLPRDPRVARFERVQLDIESSVEPLELERLRYQRARLQQRILIERIRACLHFDERRHRPDNALGVAQLRASSSASSFAAWLSRDEEYAGEHRVAAHQAAMAGKAAEARAVKNESWPAVGCT